MKHFRFLLFIAIMVALSACDKKGNNGNEGGGGEEPDNPVYDFSGMKEIFGFYGQNRYSYCPSIIKESNGTAHMYFCGNPNQNVMVDNIYHVRINPDGSQTSAKSVLQPGDSGTWDDHHTCDPSVVEGKFLWNGVSYKYAMFFLSNMYGVYYNEIGVAFSNSLEADSWVKYPEQIVKKTWANDGDQVLGNGGKSWGVGQPSVVSLNREGKLLLTYTIGDLSGTRIAWREADFSIVENYTLSPPRTIVQSGLKTIDNKGNDYTCNSEFAINKDADMIIMIRPVQPHPTDYPAYLNISLELVHMKLSDFMNQSGSWTPIYRIIPGKTGFPRNHNAGIERNSFGEVVNWNEPTIYYTVSKAAPDVSAASGKHAEWTYHIWRGTVLKK